MSATLIFGTELATVNSGLWSGDNPTLVDLLTAMTGDLRPLGPSGDDPDPDLSLAQDAARRLGGEVVRSTPRDLDAETPEGVTY